MPSSMVSSLVSVHVRRFASPLAEFALQPVAGDGGGRVPVFPTSARIHVPLASSRPQLFRCRHAYPRLTSSTSRVSSSGFLSALPHQLVVCFTRRRESGARALLLPICAGACARLQSGPHTSADCEIAHLTLSAVFLIGGHVILNGIGEDFMHASYHSHRRPPPRPAAAEESWLGTGAFPA